MKKNTIILCLIMLLLFTTASHLYAKRGTYRIYTGMRGWRVKNAITGEEKDAVIVPQFPPNPWDSPSYDVPRPWYKLYEREDAHWISWANPPQIDPVGSDMWVYSPAFKMYNNISRATIWLSVDDQVRIVLLRNINTGSTIDLGITTPLDYVGFSRLYRFDVTDQFRSCSVPGENPPHQLEFYVNDMSAPGSVGCIGLIAYMSYDCDEGVDIEPTTYHYELSNETSTTNRFISMPFYPVEISPGVMPTIRDLFGSTVDYAYTYNPEVGDMRQVVNLDTPLDGRLGDSVRTYGLKLVVNPYTPLEFDFEGWPVLEQRYLDINTNNVLYFGSVTQESGVRFPDVYPDCKINNSGTWEYWDADGGTELDPHNPTYYNHTRYEYKSIPETGEYTLPYSLDIDGGYGYRDLVFGEDLFEPKIFSHTGPEFACLESIDEGDTLTDEMVEACIEEYYAELRRRELLPGLPDFSEEESPKIASSLSRNPNKLAMSVYPIPFNSLMRIEIKLPSESNLTVCIFDISGSLIRTLHSGRVQGGKNSYSWNGLDNFGNSVSSGIYYCKATTSNEVVIEKTILLK